MRGNVNNVVLVCFHSKKDEEEYKHIVLKSDHYNSGGMLVNITNTKKTYPALQ